MGAVNIPKDDHPLDVNRFATPSMTDELSESLSLIRQTLDVDPKTGIKDCTYLHKRYGLVSQIYSVASECYIRLKNFSDAEVSILTALHLGDKTIANYVNLANLVFMRGDQILAFKWLENAAAIDPKDTRIFQIKEKLFPSGSIPSTCVFQIEGNSITEGNFV